MFMRNFTRQEMAAIEKAKADYATQRKLGTSQDNALRVAAIHYASTCNISHETAVTRLTQFVAIDPPILGGVL